MIEIFKTNVESVEESQLLIRQLQAHFPTFKINFDLDDCDRILRIEGNDIVTASISGLLSSFNYTCEVLA